MSSQKSCLSFAIHCGPKQAGPSLHSQNLSLWSYLYVYYMPLTPGYEICEARGHVCLGPSCFPNVYTRAGIILIISIITVAGIYCRVQCVGHGKKGFM